VSNILRYIDKLRDGGEEWEYRFWGVDSEGEDQVFKAYGDGDGLYNASREDYTSYTGWRGILWGRGGTGLADNIKDLEKALRSYRLKNLSWERRFGSKVALLQGPLAREVEKVLKKHRDRRHFMEGGRGVSCFVWINGQVAASENSLRLDNGVEKALRAIPGVNRVKINID
jgi:hypothetical protein